MIIIVGAGLSGLLIGYRLKTLGIPFKIIEASERVGGRIHTVLSEYATPVEMGATWFGDQHVHLKQLLKELDIRHFEQFMKGTAFYQPVSTSPPQSITIPAQQASYRIEGGTFQLVKKLAKRIGEDSIVLNAPVDHIEFLDDHALVYAGSVYKASRVVLAIPPKLWANKIKITPSVPVDLARIALSTHTWMEESIKVALVYESPFWRLNQHSGAFFSNAGPVTEFYDHANSDGSKHALCGFVSPGFADLTAEERKRQVVDQIAEAFGREARGFQEYLEVVWRDEERTHSRNIVDLIPHQNNGNPIFRKVYYDGKLLISSSESAESYPGYMEGAVFSADFVIKKITQAKKL